ncbi:hypothetical protein Taro_046043 [Colocasia esculenta]|uniref:Transmembrane protein n=1 Tax=Colocasia esculenta TaxID=4460 RepID=A0A843X3L8_COLES|nr:hypothetical protein [Colocasia esculenta]
MHLSTGFSDLSWKPVMTARTNTLEYWLNWRFLVCAIEVFSSMLIATILIWKYEGFNAGEEGEEAQEEAAGTLYDDESWRPCLKEIHPAWLLAFRVTAFLVLTALLIINIAVQGGEMFYFYTQWTFTLVATYFGVGSLLSIYGCQKFRSKVDSNMLSQMRLETEQGTYVVPTSAESTNTADRMKTYGSQEEYYMRPVGGFWGYAFQIIYQTNAGAVVLTDCVFWLIIVPFLTMRDYSLNFVSTLANLTMESQDASDPFPLIFLSFEYFLLKRILICIVRQFMIGMHSVNAVFLLGDTALNSLRFPWYRISYFVLWTGVYVIFQWVIHACIPIWWPYPFLDMSSSYAPIWYLSVAVMHIPCYAIFMVITKLKHLLLSRCFPQSYVCLR